ncbi:hypothetical protein GOP47_0018541 [Adiantum capillus-veneris]|uniref:Inhibitor of Bruton tyrosine kinase n=1 Tax=Adiantum capillus-veneris TaxID=13818 RepID=A0A9D4Z9Q9_ADICA|nr:hypothetical protein GOP47_0018541 [Adiantum capillus-veneris]
MELSAANPVVKQGSARKTSTSTSTKDLWAAVRNGSPGDVECALVALKKSNGNIDARNSFGSTALHIAVWRNHIPIVRRLLTAGSNMDIRDGESGWSSLHRALHFGHLAVAGVLIEAGANLVLEDSKGRTPIDLVSGPVKQVIGDPSNAGGTEVFSWGNGANYQLGTGTTGIQKLPGRLDALQGLNVTAIAAAKFHSMAATADGKLYSWGFGRGGRLGFSDFDIHSGQVAVITPQLVSCGIGNRRVKIIAVAKHHSLVVTEGGEVFTWGSNREGQLGYTSVDTQPTPRRVSTLKAKVVAAAAANKHSAVLTEAGEVFTWGCNREGQLGYGTSNSASNPVPRVVEYVKGKIFCSVSAAKYHTVVLGSEGEVFTWGYKLVMPRRVSIARNTRKAGNTLLKFHQAERLHIVAVAAGTTHSTAISEDGLIFFWFSADPNVRCHQLMALSGHQALAVAAGKYRTAVVTALGDIYAWDGEKAKDEMPPVPFRIHGVKHNTLISVGENHSLAVAAVYMPSFQSHESNEVSPQAERESEDFEEDIEFDEMGIALSARSKTCNELSRLPLEPPTLKELCENVISQHVVEPKNALQLLEIADSVEASKLRKHCEDLVLHNLDYLLTVSPTAFAHVTPTLLADLEKALDATSSQPWSHRLFPTPTALFPAIVDSEEDDCDSGLSSRMRSLSLTDSSNVNSDRRESEGLFDKESRVDQAVIKQLRALKKKLQQIEALELRQSRGHVLDHQQLAKLETKLAIKDAILALDSGAVFTADINEGESQLSVDFTAEGFQGKEIGNRRNRNGRRKSNKLVAEQVPADESQKKSRSGQLNKVGNRKCEDGIAETQIQLKSFPSAEKADQHKTVEPTFLSDSDSEASQPSKKSIAIAVEGKGQVKIQGFVANTSEGLVQSSPSQKKKQKKGGLSMFLSGALDCVTEVPAPEPTPPLPKSEGPAWGGAKQSSRLSSLREIQSQQTAEASAVAVDDSLGIHFESKSMRTKQIAREQSRVPSELEEHCSTSPVDTGVTRYSLGQFIRTSAPIAVMPVKSTKVCASVNSDSSPTPWAGTSPLTAASSFKEIQMEQVKGKKPQKHGGSHTPSNSSGLMPANAGLEEVADEKVPSRWFKPDIHSPSSIRCIQIEEQAMKEIRRMYKNVKVARSGEP